MKGDCYCHGRRFYHVPGRGVKYRARAPMLNISIMSWSLCAEVWLCWRWYEPKHVQPNTAPGLLAFLMIMDYH